MTTTDRAAFAEGMAILGETFGESLSEGRIEAYYEALCDLEIGALAGAMRSAMRHCRFFPRPVELREFVIGGSVEVQIEAAWIAWRQATHRIGGYRSIVLADAALGETLLAVFGSWPAACRAELSPEMWASKRKEFDRAYRVMAARRKDRPVYLPGECEAHNSRRQEWQAFTPVGLLDASGARLLTEGEAAAYRQQFALPEPDAPLGTDEARAFLGEIQKRLTESVARAAAGRDDD